MIKPQKLHKGDTVGLITPASFITDSKYEISIKNLESLGLNVVHFDSVKSKHGYLAGTDEERVNELHKMFANPEIKAIVCARGGYGTPRILPLLDYDLIRKNPKILIGFSDITALLQAVFVKTGLVCFHGPMGVSDFSNYTVESLMKTLIEPEQERTFFTPTMDLVEEKSEEFEMYTITKGIAEGELFGGNLALMAALVGTPYDIDYSGKIIFIEEIGEEPYRIDRMLTQLLLAGKFQQASGIVLGVFSNCVSEEPEGNSLSLKEVLVDRLSSLNIPVAYGLRFGHIIDNATIPLGIRASFDAESFELRLLEGAVL